MAAQLRGRHRQCVLSLRIACLSGAALASARLCKVYLCVLQVINEFLNRHGSEEGGDYFLGGTYSAAETITTPFVRRMLLVLPALRDVDVDAILKQEGLDRLDRWFKVSSADKTWAVGFRALRMAALSPMGNQTWSPCQRDLQGLGFWASLKSGAPSAISARSDGLENMCVVQACLDRPSNKSTGPSDEELVTGIKLFLQQMSPK